MKITDIKESGCNNLLRWAIKNGAKINQDSALQSMINNELSYLVTFSDVTFFEMFRLTQMYRDDLAIIATTPASLPTDADLATRFPGKYTDPESKEEVPYIQYVTNSINHLINLALQMNTDSDIIASSVPQLFLPMISRRYDIRIPISFRDIISFVQTQEEADKLFNGLYPGNLYEQVVTNPESNIRRMLMLGFVRSTEVVRYDRTYDKYLSAIKYLSLMNSSSDTVYKFALAGFHKHDRISKLDIHASMFYPDREAMANTLRILNQTNDSLKIDFMVQLPLHYMQIMLNSFSYDEMAVGYESSMKDIIMTGIPSSFLTPFGVDHDEDEDTIKAMETSLTEYRVRINEANQLALGAIKILHNGDCDADSNSIFALLPSIYNTKAQITLDLKYADRYLNYSQDPVIASLLSEMMNLANGLLNNIKSSK